MDTSIRGLGFRVWGLGFGVVWFLEFGVSGSRLFVTTSVFVEAQAPTGACRAEP